MRLINVLHPERFWEGKHANLHGQIGSEHKGGVVFDYRTPNPWLGRKSRDIPKPLAEAPADAVESEVAGLKLSVAKTENPKCGRCWHHLPDVGTHAEHPEICGP